MPREFLIRYSRCHGRTVAAVATATALVALFSVGAGHGILISSARRLLLNSAMCVDPFRAGFAPIREFFIRRLAPRI